MPIKLAAQRHSRAEAGGSLYVDVLPEPEDVVMLRGRPLSPDEASSDGKPRLPDHKYYCSPDRRSTQSPHSPGYFRPGQSNTSGVTQTASGVRPDTPDITYHYTYATRRSGEWGSSMQSMQLRTNTTHKQKFAVILKRMRSPNSRSDSPNTGTTSEPPILPRIDTGPSIKKLLLPDERSPSDMRLPPIAPIDPTIYIPLLLEAVEERCGLSERVVQKCDAISIVSQDSSVSTTKLLQSTFS
ncbi:hypothetical protein EDC04DRAFT_2898304 [Pisolithus marmoratus]|nr:hypothetical protein EDC04DRAFT_2898304 [Pisolithus marmoratus]